MTLGLAWCLINVAAADDAPVSFDRDIRPILSENCYHCHGPDAEAREADLRLDTYAGMTEFVVVPGEPDDSELVRRIESDDEWEQMPPADSGYVLSQRQKDLLRQWIAEGAEFNEHWAFRPLPTQVDVPTVGDRAWPRQAIDRFVLARLESEGLSPTSEAEPLRLLRRITLDLTGLPPTVAEIRAFEKAAAIDLQSALEQAVDRLLASPAYGEHMAVAWLDAARYADSHGYQSDQLNTQWPYRDWVVQALNDNMPYDQFVTWQLAGDLIERPSRDSILATAFNRMHRMTNEGGSIAEEWLVENAADRVHTVGTALLGLTLECARCHDHRYDPISMRDYYSMLAFFNSIDENGMYDRSDKVPSPSLLLPTPEQEARLAAAREQVAEAERALARVNEEGEERFEAWQKRGRESFSPNDESAAVESNRENDSRPRFHDRAGDADLIGYFSFDGETGEFPNEAVGREDTAKGAGVESIDGVRGRAVRFDGDRGVVFPKLLEIDRWDTFSLDFWLRDTMRNPLPVVVLHRSFGTDVGYNGFDVLLRDGVFDVRLYRVWPGNGIGVRATRPITAGEWQHVTVTYDGSSRAAGLRLFLNGEELATEVLRDRIHKSVATRAHGEGHFTLGERFRDRGFRDGEIDELRVYERPLTPLEVRHLHEHTSEEETWPGNYATAEALGEYYFSAVDTQARDARQRLRKARRELVAAEDAIHEVAVMEELPQARSAHILARGHYASPKTDANRVERNTFTEILPPFPADAPRDRLGLARWLTDADHPLTARVFVNRLWASFFGRSIVPTPEYLGQQGGTPSHPELLDWLARDFVDSGWDVKRLCRQIVLSATYRQDSRCEPELRERDPQNELLARGPSHRLSAEQIRDVALGASGLLERERGGPPVSPYQPGEDLWREANDMSPPYRQSTGEALHRRSLYSVWKRTAPLPNMTAFDAASREVCTVERSRTNTPLQALVLLNDVQFVEAARALATEVARAHPSDVAGQINEAFLRLAGRRPDDVEMRLLDDVYREQRELFASGESQDAFALLGVGDSPADPTLVPADLAALTITCQAILNLDATVFKR